jgi:predicted nucleotidyltransferase
MLVDLRNRALSLLRRLSAFFGIPFWPVFIQRGSEHLFKFFAILASMDTAALSREQIANLAQANGIRLLLLFGSVAAGREHPESDVDLGLLLENPNLAFSARADLQHELQQLFPEREVDLAIINHADPLFLKKITEQCRLLYGDASELCSLKMYAFRRYQDHKRFLEMERRYVKDLLERIINKP